MNSKTKKMNAKKITKAMPRKSLNDFSNKEMQQLQTNSLLKIEKAIRRNNRLALILVIFGGLFTVLWAIHIVLR